MWSTMPLGCYELSNTLTSKAYLPVVLLCLPLQHLKRHGVSPLKPSRHARRMIKQQQVEDGCVQVRNACTSLSYSF